MRRSGRFIAAGLAVGGLLVPVLAKPPPGLIWNASASAPIGLYAIRPFHHPVRGVLMAIMPPTWVAQLADARRYLPKGVPLLKAVAAVPGQTVCRRAARITIDGAPVAKALARDRRGRPLPVWQGCRTLGTGEIFAMNSRVRDSFDGRYFGPVPLRDVLGRARPLWTEPSSTHLPQEPRR
jgi:conjugative transfer signal peptidase TraF